MKPEPLAAATERLFTPASQEISGSHSASLLCGYTINMEELQPQPNLRPAGPALRFVAAALIVRGGEVLIGQPRAGAGPRTGRRTWHSRHHRPPRHPRPA
jgi:hypothetical protein